jgi:hypothetical protein
MCRSAKVKADPGRDGQGHHVCPWYRGEDAAEVVRRLGKMPNHIQRLLDVLHASRHEQLEEAIRVMGRRYKVEAGPALKVG